MIKYNLLYLRGIMEVKFKSIVLGVAHYPGDASGKWLFIKFLFGLTFIFVIPSCNTKPEACFGYLQIERPKNSPLLSGRPIRFTNCSIEGESFLWNFGDGAYSSEKDPIHTYDTAGIYGVTLEVRSQSRTTEYTQWLSIQDPGFSDLLPGSWTANEFYEIRQYSNQIMDTIYYGYESIKWRIHPEGVMQVEGFPETGEYNWRLSQNQLYIQDDRFDILFLNTGNLRVKYLDSVSVGLPIHPNTRAVYVSFTR